MKILKYVIMPQGEHAGQNNDVRIGNKSFEDVEQFRYLEKTITNQNSIHKEIKSILKSGNACYYLVQNLLCFILYGCEAWSVTLRKEHGLRLFENGVLR